MSQGDTRSFLWGMELRQPLLLNQHPHTVLK